MSEGIKMFEWPCGRRDAHHPHTVLEDDGTVYECPGVAAHPLTQIGGNYNEEQVPE